MIYYYRDRNKKLRVLPVDANAKVWINDGNSAKHLGTLTELVGSSLPARLTVRDNRIVEIRQIFMA